MAENTPANSTLNIDIHYNKNGSNIINQNYTFVAYAITDTLTISAGGTLSGVVTLQNIDGYNVYYSKNISFGDITYWIYSSVVAADGNYASAKPNPIVLSNLRQKDPNVTNSLWEFTWWFTNDGSSSLYFHIDFVIFFYTINQAYELSTVSTTNSSICKIGNAIDTGYFSNSFPLSGNFDFKKFFPIVSYSSKEITTVIGSTNINNIGIMDYNSDYIVLYEITTIDGLVPTFNTLNYQQVIIHDKYTNSFSLTFYSNTTGSLKFNFIICYYSTPLSSSVVSGNQSSLQYDSSNKYYKSNNYTKTGSYGISEGYLYNYVPTVSYVWTKITGSGNPYNNGGNVINIINRGTTNYVVLTSFWYNYSGSSGTYNAANSTNALGQVVIYAKTNSSFRIVINRTTGNNMRISCCYTIIYLQ